MHITKNGLNMIKSFEGCRLTPYKDVAGYLTVGYGHLTGSTATISPEKASEYLESDIAKFERMVNGLPYTMNQYQFDALVSFAFNIGGVRQLTDNGKRTLESLSSHMQNYVHACGRRVEGLVLRRRIEGQVFECTTDKRLQQIFARNKIPWYYDTVSGVYAKEYIPGETYTTLVGLFIRDSPWGRILNKNDWTLDAKKHDVNPENCCLDAGTRVTCQAEKRLDDASVWIKIPSGWICAVNKNRKYVE